MNYYERYGHQCLLFMQTVVAGAIHVPWLSVLAFRFSQGLDGRGNDVGREIISDLITCKSSWIKVFHGGKIRPYRTFPRMVLTGDPL